MKTKYILVFVFLSFSHQLLPSEEPLSSAEKQFLKKCKKGDLTSIEKFLEQHSTIDVNKKDKDGCTALHFICCQAYPNEKQACEIATMLIQKGANLNIQTTTAGCTPLHYACFYNNSLLIKILINNNKVEVNKKSKYESTALHLICDKNYDKKTEKLACQIAKMLIQKGADPNLKNTISGYTPLHYACKHENRSLIKTLINNGTNVAIKTTLLFNTPYQLLSKPYIIRNEFSSEPILLEPMYAALFDSSNQKNILATSLLPEIAHIIKDFYLNLCLNDLKAEKWIWEPVCIEACAEAYKKDNLALDNVTDRQQCLARVLFWPKARKLEINAILHEKERTK